MRITITMLGRTLAFLALMLGILGLPAGQLALADEATVVFGVY